MTINHTRTSYTTMTSSYSSIYKNASEVPDDIASTMHQEVLRSIRQPIEVIFPAFGKAFPQTVDAMSQLWGRPFLATKKVTGEWLNTLAMRQGKLNLYFDLTSVYQCVDGDEFNASHQMLPLAWTELYRWFWSFVITTASFQPNTWRDTPLPFSERLSIDEYQSEVGTENSVGNAFFAKYGAKPEALRCWLLTQAGDGLFLDEQKCDHRVFHAHKGNLEDVVVLTTSEVQLDSYLAHVVSGRPSKDFDFRATR